MEPEYFVVVMTPDGAFLVTRRPGTTIHKKFTNYWEAWKLCCKIASGRVSSEERFTDGWRWYE